MDGEGKSGKKISVGASLGVITICLRRGVISDSRYGYWPEVISCAWSKLESTTSVGGFIGSVLRNYGM